MLKKVREIITSKLLEVESGTMASYNEALKNQHEDVYSFTEKLLNPKHPWLIA